MSNIFNKALEEMDKHLDGMSDEEFISKYNLCEVGIGPTIREFLLYDEILEALPDDYFRIGDKNAQRIERIYES